eukprot:1158027-Pelagomonas_calceolata.AAC.20
MPILLDMLTNVFPLGTSYSQVLGPGASRLSRIPISTSLRASSAYVVFLSTRHTIENKDYITARFLSQVLPVALQIPTSLVCSIDLFLWWRGLTGDRFLMARMDKDALYRWESLGGSLLNASGQTASANISFFHYVGRVSCVDVNTDLYWECECVHACMRVLHCHKYQKQEAGSQGGHQKKLEVMRERLEKLENQDFMYLLLFLHSSPDR